MKQAAALMDAARRRFSEPAPAGEEQQRLARLAVDSAGDAIYWLDEAGRFVFANDAACREFCRRRDELLQMNVQQIAPDLSPSAWRDIWQRLRKQRWLRFETRYRARDGAESPAEVGACYAECGDRALCFAFSRSLAERKATEAALRASEERLKRAQEVAHVGSWALDLVHNELSWSDEAYRIFGLRPQQFGATYEAFLALVHPDDRAAVGGAYMSSLREGRDVYEIEHRVVRAASGEIRTLHAKCEHVRDASGRVVRSVGTIADITERRRAEDELRAAKAEAERANNAKSRFLAAASHDLRQPLAALSLYVGVLAQKLLPGDATLLKNMKDCCASLSEMLSDLLDLSKLAAGVVKPEISDFSLDCALARLISVHSPEADSKRLRLNCRRSGLTVRTDPVLFGRIVANLLSNALRYTERGGVLVGCRRHRGRRWVEVWDTGIGIPGDKTSEIFEEFRQLDNDARDRSKGSGLGLAIVARTAELLGLAIRVRSRPGRGSMFAIEVPVGEPAAIDREPRPPRRRLHIGLVDDDALVAEAFTYALGEAGHRLTVAAGGAELIARLDGRAPDIVVTDYRLAGGETGLDVIAALREAFGNALPALLITGDTAPELMRGMIDHGVRVLHKPVELDVLLACIDDLAAAGGH